MTTTIPYTLEDGTKVSVTAEFSGYKILAAVVMTTDDVKDLWDDLSPREQAHIFIALEKHWLEMRL